MATETTQMLQPDHQTVQTIKDREADFARWVNEGAYDRLVNEFYSNDARFFPPNAPAATGTNEIRRVMEGLSNQYSDVKLQNTGIVASGDIAVSYGTYTSKVKTGGTERGKYIEVWRRANGDWKCFLDTFNSDA